MSFYSSCKALIIGINEYADPQHNLTYARSDAEAMAEVLGNEFGFDQIWTLYDADATKGNIIRFFERDLQRTDDDDGLLIFFSGHGITATSGIGDERGFLVPHDGKLDMPYANLSLTTIRDDYLLMIPAKHVFLIVDACYGGLALKDITAVEQSTTIDESVIAELTRSNRKVRQVLVAGKKNQNVLDGGLFGHSIFTGRLIEALREANPYITADHICVHVRERVAHDAKERNHQQTPQFGLLYGSEGSFVFKKKTRHPHEAPPDIEKELAEAQSFFNSGQWEKAIAAAEKGLKKNSLSYELKEIKREAKEELVKERDKKLRDEDIRNAHFVAKQVKDAERYEADGDINSAIECLEEAVKYESTGKAAAMLERFRSREAIEGKTKAQKLRTLFNKAKELEKPDPESAIALYEEALQIDPGNPTARDGIKRCKTHIILNEFSDKINSANNSTAMRKNEISEYINLLKKDIAEYKELTMIAELDKSRQDLDEQDALLEEFRTLNLFYSSIKQCISESGSFEELVKSVRDNNSVSKRAKTIILQGFDCDREILVSLFPAFIDAGSKFDEWLAGLEKTLKSQKEYELELAVERSRVKEETQRRQKEHEKILAEERKRVWKEQDILDKKWEQIPWYQKLTASRPEAVRKHIPPPAAVKQKKITTPKSLRESAIREFPYDCIRAFGIKCFDEIPDTTSNGIDLTVIKENVRRIFNTKSTLRDNTTPDQHKSPGADQRRTTYAYEPFPRYVEKVAGFNEVKLGWTIDYSAWVIIGLAEQDRKVNIKRLGEFYRGETGKLEFSADPDLTTTSRNFSNQLRSEYELEEDEIRDCLLTWGLIPEYCRASENDVTITGFGKFNIEGKSNLVFKASQSLKLKKTMGKRKKRM